MEEYMNGKKRQKEQLEMRSKIFFKDFEDIDEEIVER